MTRPSNHQTSTADQRTPPAGLAAAWQAAWPIGFPLVAIVGIVARGQVNKWFVVLEFTLLAAFAFLGIRYEFPSFDIAMRQREIVILLVVTIATLTIVLPLAAFVSPTKSEDFQATSARIQLGTILVFSIVLTFGIFLLRKQARKLAWIALFSILELSAVLYYFTLNYLELHGEIRPWLWQTCVWVFFALLAGSLVLRAFVYASRDPLRWSIVVLVFLSAGWWFARAFAPLDGWAVGILDVVAGPLLITILLMLVFDGRRGAAGHAHTGVWVRRGSLYTAAFATVSLTAACVLATFGRMEVPRPAGLAVQTGAEVSINVAGLARSAPRTFSAIFAPILLFPDRDRWEPITVGEYLQAAPAVRWPDRSDVEDRTPVGLEKSCAVAVPEPCRVISIDCLAVRPRDPTCSEGPGFRRENESPSGSAPVYVRIVELGSFQSLEKTKRLRIELVGPYHNSVKWLVQYWYFYFYDKWETQSLFGDLTQIHEADWESVTIGFSTRKPLFVAFSAHCGGRWQDWEEVTVARDSSEPTEADRAAWHPLVLVGSGSQAMYPGLRARVYPDWAACLGIGGATLSLLTVGLNVREDVGSELSVRSKSENVISVTETRFPMNVHARWGPPNGTVEFVTKLGKRFGRDTEQGPFTPSRQAVWVKPLRTIFCHKAWKPSDCVVPKRARYG